ncbi:hypothetical protein E6O75_ATG03032 [Venturia nashicola]|uniref:Uncharacterized protein n=1 Tax=Venturia nashicola TaxID=86259 RepID=A0A4Z1PDS3_9PEZI|nr:hypothetical protein E6O75_ATG03032 [Venturia nashicola]
MSEKGAEKLNEYKQRRMVKGEAKTIHENGSGRHSAYGDGKRSFQAVMSVLTPGASPQMITEWITERRF